MAPPSREDVLLREIQEEVADACLEELGAATEAGPRPPPPLRGEVPPAVMEEKQAMLRFLQSIPGVHEIAAHTVSWFFQSFEALRAADVATLAAIPDVKPEEARRIKDAVDRLLGARRGVPS